MSTTGSARGLVRQALLERLRNVPAVAGVQIEAAMVADLAHEHIMLGQITGQMQTRHMVAGRKQRTDEFSVDVWISAGKAGQPAAVAEARAVQLLDALDGVLADDPLLGAVPGLQWARLGTVDGPDLAATDSGYVAQVAAQVDCLAHYW